MLTFGPRIVQPMRRLAWSKWVPAHRKVEGHIPWKATAWRWSKTTSSSWCFCFTNCCGYSWTYQGSSWLQLSVCWHVFNGLLGCYCITRYMGWHSLGALSHLWNLHHSPYHHKATKNISLYLFLKQVYMHLILLWGSWREIFLCLFTISECPCFADCCDCLGPVKCLLDYYGITTICVLYVFDIIRILLHY